MLAVQAFRCIGITQVSAGAVAGQAATVVPATCILYQIAAQGAEVANLGTGHLAGSRRPDLGLLGGHQVDAGVPVVVHCGHGPVPGAHTGLDVFEDVLRRHPSLVAVLAHAGMPDYLGALDLVARYPGVHVDTTMVGVPFTQARAALPADWAARLVDVADRVVLGSDFPNIPYDYSEQLDAIRGWAAADDRLGEPFLRAVLHDNGARLLGISPG